MTGRQARRLGKRLAKIGVEHPFRVARLLKDYDLSGAAILLEESRDRIEERGGALSTEWGTTFLGDRYDHVVAISLEINGKALI